MQTTVDSPRAIAARTNGAKSKGPKTEEGKARSSRNALKHGLTAINYVGLPGEEAQVEAFTESIFEELKPDGVLQCAIVKRIANCLWQLLKAPAVEDSLVHSTKGEHFPNGICHYGQRYDVQWAHARLALSRYAARIQRDYERSLDHLQKLKELANNPTINYTPEAEINVESGFKQNEPNATSDQSSTINHQSSSPAPRTSPLGPEKSHPNPSSSDRPDTVADILKALKFVGTYAFPENEPTTRHERRHGK